MNIKFKGFDVQVDKSWDNFLKDSIKDNLKEIEPKIANNYTPENKNILRFMSIDINNVKVVILGQDPYPQKENNNYIATGRAFEVSNLSDWKDLKNKSLQNILKLLCVNNRENKTIPSFEEVKQEIRNKNFKILPPDKFFTNLEKQGVLLLNTALTCEVGKSNSHKNIWKNFILEIIKYIDSENPNIKWLLWGDNAKKLYSKTSDYTCFHPTARNKKEESFFRQNHFSKIKEINWCGDSYTPNTHPTKL